jgi:hypothetical protein
MTMTPMTTTPPQMWFKPNLVCPFEFPSVTSHCLLQSKKSVQCLEIPTLRTWMDSCWMLMSNLLILTRRGHAKTNDTMLTTSSNRLKSQL